MKRVFIPLFLGLSGIFAVNCKTADNSNIGSNVAVVVNTSSANENTAAKPLPETVPTFGNAEEAAAAGDKYLDTGATENAIDAFRQAVKINPDFAEGFFKLGIAYSLRAKEEGYSSTETASEEAAATPKKGKKDVPVLSDSDKAFENAAKVYEKILKKDSKNAQALFNLGRAYNKLNKDTEAEKALRQAVKLSPDENDYQIEFGAILIKLAQYDEAVTVLSKVAKLDESNLYLQDLLEKAQAGKKRINFGVKPKPQQEDASKQKPDKTKPKTSPTPQEQSTNKPAANKQN